MVYCESSASFSALPNGTSESEIDKTNTAFYDDVNDIQMLVDDADDGTACPTQHDRFAAAPFMFSTDQKWTISLLI